MDNKERSKMNDEIPLINTGFIDGSVTEDLWLAGTIPYEVVLSSGDWRPYLPTGEKQRPYSVDWMACVSFSNLSSLETQTKQQTGMEVNYSDRFTAKMSDTKPSGNYFDKVADSTRLHGVVLESDYPTVGNISWNEYYKEIPQEIKNKAIKLDIAYEKIVVAETELRYHLKQSPIQVSIPAPHANHAVLLVHIENGKAYYFDSYPGTTNYLKTIAVSKLSRALKIVLKGHMNQTKIVLGKDGKTVYKATPVATDFENFKKQMSVEGIAVPDPIPPASNL